jgi:hypothetical protein
MENSDGDGEDGDPAPLCARVTVPKLLAIVFGISLLPNTTMQILPTDTLLGFKIGLSSFQDRAGCVVCVMCELLLLPVRVPCL